MVFFNGSIAKKDLEMMLSVTCGLLLVGSQSSELLRQLVASFAYFLNIILCSHPYVFFYGCYAIDFVVTKYTESRHKLLKYKI
jgi:hypothetical protein